MNVLHFIVKKVRSSVLAVHITRQMKRASPGSVAVHETNK